MLKVSQEPGSDQGTHAVTWAGPGFIYDSGDSAGGDIWAGGGQNMFPRGRVLNHIAIAKDADVL